MKYLKIIFVFLGIIMLSSCIRSISEKTLNLLQEASEYLSGIPSEIIIDGKTYRNGFYDGLYPINFTYSNDRIKVGSNYFRRVNYEKFDLVKISNDGSVIDILYCAEDQWEQAYNYYSNKNNLIYYCKIGMENIYRNSVIKIIHDMDHELFDKLMDFVTINEYDPFNSNKKLITHRLPFPDDDEFPELVFYKESNDGHFTSSKANKFYIINNKLLLVYFYDYGFGKYQEIVVVDVPDDIGQYFVKLLENID